MIHPERIRNLNERPVSDGAFVLYWMQASQRAHCNHALQYAVREANRLGKPVVVCFGLTAQYPEANERHYAFMLEGLAETARSLATQGIQFVARLGEPDEVALGLADDACLLVADCGYLRCQKRWREQVAKKAPCRVTQVEADVVIPVAGVSEKEEYAARTIRPKIHRRLDEFLVPLSDTKPKHSSANLPFAGLDLSDVDALLQALRVDDGVGRVQAFIGGTNVALRLLDQFVGDKLDDYDELRNEPSLDYVSHMSPYLHFGQISPLHVALVVKEAGGPGVEAYLEELIVRRELSMNFVNYNPDYDEYECLPDWALRTLDRHAGDPRPDAYTAEQLELGETGDEYWNAAQREMVVVGKMHNYTRMYWGKKILEWSESPEDAFHTALRLNNKYELDGRDANSFTGVAWCFGKHDRPWKERPIFGTVRYMNAAGLRRKFAMDDSRRKVRDLGG